MVGRLCDGELDGGGRHALHGLLLEQKADLGIVLTFEHANTGMSSNRHAKGM